MEITLPIAGLFEPAEHPTTTPDADAGEFFTPQALVEVVMPPPRRTPGMAALVQQLKQADQDHEFYPTTDEIIRALARELGLRDKEGHRRHDEYSSILDIGAGTGKVLLAIRELCGISDLHAIEKSNILTRELDPSILVVGTEFQEQSLLSKAVDVIFCNPPYSQFEQWSEKIIRQAASAVAYLVIPKRWEQSLTIKDALKFRNVSAFKVGEFDFEDAEDRQARAKVHLLKIKYFDRYDRRGEGGGAADAFARFFEEQFADLINKFKGAKFHTCPKCLSKKLTHDKEEDVTTCDDCGWDSSDKYREEEKERNRPMHNLVPGPNYPEAMVNLYRAEIEHIESNYKLVAQLDADLLRELEISPEKIMGFLMTRLTGLRNDYWKELFSRLNTITNRLTAGSRQKLLTTLNKHVQVDFTVSNILEVIIWVIKNANQYLESQLIETYEVMVDKCNVQLYKSNKKVWVDDRWRYNGEPAKNSHYKLDYRMVTHRTGGIRAGSFSFERGLDERARTFLGDLMTIANNLGFRCETSHFKFGHAWRDQWVSGAKHSFLFTKRGGASEELFDVRAFKNGNLHMRLNQDFILALNVEYGRLKGWLRNGQHAAEELDEPAAAQYFRANLQLSAGNPALMLGIAA